MTTPTHFLPPPERCEPLADIVARCGGIIRQRAAATRVDYRLPTEAAPEVRAFFQARASVVVPADYVANLPGGCVFGSGNVLSPDGRSVARDVSLDHGKSETDHWLLTYKKIKPPVLLRGATAVVATTLGAGYGHWLLEELPRLLTLPPREGAALIAHAATPYQRAALALGQLPDEVIEPKRFSHYACEQLIVPSLQGVEGQPTPQSVALVREFTAPLGGAGVSHRGEKLYITRQNARRRKLSNEAALWPRLEARGFARVVLEELSWAEQIAAFRAAKAIVAPHGAGLANLVFCEPGTRVVELFHRDYVHWTYWQLASLLALDYLPLVSVGDGPVRHRLASNRLDIEADVDAVLANL